MRLPIMRLPILFVVCVVAARPSAGVAQMGAGMGIGGAAGGPQVQTAPAGATRLYVKTLPPGAQVTLDGTVLGQSDGLFLVPAGTKTVSVQFDGAQPEVRQVEIAEGRITRVEIGMNAGGGAIGGGGLGGVGFAVPPDFVPEIRLTSNRPPVTPAPLSGMEDVLAKPVKAPLEFQGTSLRDVVDWIHREAGVAVLVDEHALVDSGVDPAEMTVTSSAAAGLPLASVLDVVLRDAETLTWLVRDDLIEITTKNQPGERLVVRTHDVSDLVDAKGEDGLVELILRFVAPETWDVRGGNGTIRSLPSPAGMVLGVRHDYRVQRQVAEFLAALRRVKATPVEQRRPLADTGYWSDRPAAAAARAALDKPVSVDFQGLSLRNAAALLAKQASVPIGFDAAALRNAGVDPDASPVTLAVQDLPLDVVLNRILEPAGLVVEARDEGLVVTTRKDSFESMSVAFYPVDDLVGEGRTVGWLASMVLRLLTPEEWRENGGPGDVVPVAGDMSGLVVRQSTAGHRAVDALLSALRRLQSTPVEQRRPLAGTGYWSDRPAATAARAALDKPVSVDFQNTSLRAVRGRLAKAAGVPIGFDVPALNDAGVDIDALRVALVLEDKPLDVVMNRILEPADLVVEAGDEGLIVTTKEKASDAMSAAFYPVDRLIGGGRAIDELASMVQCIVAPETWEHAGGGAFVVPVAGEAACLGIQQTTAGHRAVAAFLRSLPAAPGAAPEQR